MDVVDLGVADDGGVHADGVLRPSRVAAAPAAPAFAGAAPGDGRNERVGDVAALRRALRFRQRR